MVMPRKMTSMEETDAGGPETVSPGTSTESNHHEIPRDRYNSYVSSPGNVPGGGVNGGKILNQNNGGKKVGGNGNNN